MAQKDGKWYCDECTAEIAPGSKRYSEDAKEVACEKCWATYVKELTEEAEVTGRILPGLQQAQRRQKGVWVLLILVCMAAGLGVGYLWIRPATGMISPVWLILSTCGGLVVAIAVGAILESTMLRAAEKRLMSQ